MKKISLLFGLLFATIMMVAQPTVSIENQKMLITDGKISYVLAPNGDNASYFWASVSPDGKHIVYVTAKYGTYVCDINGENVRFMGRMNAPKWLDNNHVSGMQEFYKGHDEIDYIRYISRNINDQTTRDLSEIERAIFIEAERLEQAADLERQSKRLAAKRAEKVTRTDLSGIKIYINPGHGGHDSNDRSIWTIPIPETWTNPNGYWESNSNLVKGLALQEMLEKAGATVIMSRTTNKSGERDIEEYPNATKGSPLYNELMQGDDRDLGAIGREASDNDVDHFLSIHSNALNGGRLNYLLMLYRGYNDEPKVPQSDEMAKSGAASQIKNELTVWSASEPKIYGDITFYGEEHGGLGVLKLLTVPGFLSEGSFHDYAPETHRLMNKDYCKLEALRMFQHFHKWFEAPLPQTATISGWVKSGNELVDVLGDKLYYDGKLKYVYVKNSDDQWLPINGAKVELYKGETLVNTYITDDWYNGIFAFYDLEPGTYKVVVTYKNYSTYTQEVTVKAEEIAQVKARINNLRLTLPDYPESKADISAIDNYNFEPVGRKVDAPKNLVRAIYRNNKYFILADGKLTQYDIDFSNPTSITMPADVEICDFGFTADSYLVAKVKDQGKFYTWDENNDNPVELFTVSDIKGNSFAVSGARWESKYYLAEEKTIYQVAYDEDKKTAKVVTKTNKKDLTGKQLTIMPNGEISSVDGASFINYDHVYMAKPGNGMSFQLFDVNDGVEKAKAVSAVYPEDTNATDQPIAVTMAWVDEYIIHVVIVAEGYGMQHFQTITAPVANIFASELSFDEKNFSFRLNENATDVVLTLEKGNQEVESKSLGALKKGAHSIENPFPGTDFDYFSITATAQPVAFPTKISNDDKIFQFYAARGVAVDKTPESPYFGRIYVTNSLGGQCGEEGSAPAKSYRNSSMGVFVLSSDFKDITKQGNEGWLGNVAWGENKLNTGSGIYQFPLSRPAVAPDGDVFIASTALTSAGVYIMNPAEPAAPFVQLFDGPRRNKDNGQIMAKNKKAVANPVMHCCILGTGKDEVLYTLDRDASKGTIYTSINQYNIGEATEFPWTTEPSAIFYDDKIDNFMENGCGQIAYDQRGGFFLSQYRANSSWARPALLHVNKDGEWDFNISNNGVDAAMQGGMSITVDGSMIALATESGYVKIWDVEYDKNDVPTLTPKYEINWGVGPAMGIDFDAAGNLYIVSNSYERLMVYSMPKVDNTYTTRVPRSRATDVENTYIEQEITRSGIYTLLGQYLGEDESILPHGMYIINGKKVIK